MCREARYKQYSRVIVPMLGTRGAGRRSAVGLSS
jgi:hypothetical protein